MRCQERLIFSHILESAVTKRRVGTRKMIFLAKGRNQGNDFHRMTHFLLKIDPAKDMEFSVAGKSLLPPFSNFWANILPLPFYFLYFVQIYIFSVFYCQFKCHSQYVGFLEVFFLSCYWSFVLFVPIN